MLCHTIPNFFVLNTESEIEVGSGRFICAPFNKRSAVKEAQNMINVLYCLEKCPRYKIRAPIAGLHKRPTFNGKAKRVHSVDFRRHCWPGATGKRSFGFTCEWRLWNFVQFTKRVYKVSEPVIFNICLLAKQSTIYIHHSFLPTNANSTLNIRLKC